MDKKINNNEYIAKKMAHISKKLLKEHPILTPYYARTEEGKKEYDGSWNELTFVPVGWQELFLRMCEKMERHLKLIGKKPTDTYFADVKEKYGTLRIYLGGYTDDELNTLSQAAEEESLLYCIACGKPTKYSCGYYYMCEDCAKQFKGPKNLLTYNDIPEYTVFDENDTHKRKAYHYDEFKKYWAVPEKEKTE